VCFAKARAAEQTADRPREETPEDMARRYEQMISRERQDKVDRFIRLVGERREQREREEKGPFWRRNLTRIIEYPIMFLGFVLVTGLAIIALMKIRVRRKGRLPADPNEAMKFVKRIETEAKAKMNATAAQNPRRSINPKVKRRSQSQKDKKAEEYVRYGLNEL
jgi:hypothetical protein